MGGTGGLPTEEIYSHHFEKIKQNKTKNKQKTKQNKTLIVLSCNLLCILEMSFPSFTTQNPVIFQ